MTRMLAFAVMAVVVLLIPLASAAGSSEREGGAADGASDRMSRYRAEQALRAYNSLLPRERADATARLEISLREVGPWVRDLDAAAPNVLCLGENHVDSARAFLAEYVFSYLVIDHLVLEASAGHVEQIVDQVRSGGGAPRLLGADIGAPLAAALERNPGLSVSGFERERGARAAKATDGDGALVDLRIGRDERLAEAFAAAYRPGTRHVLLYGGLHCADWPLWFFHYVRAEMADDESVRSVRLVAADQNPSLLAFARFVRALGLVDGDAFVLADTGHLDVYVRGWFPLLNQHLIEPFDTLVVYSVGHGQRSGSVQADSCAPVPDAFPHWAVGGSTRKPSTGEVDAGLQRGRWIVDGAMRKPSTGDVDLTPHRDIFPHSADERPPRKPSTGDVRVTPPREGDFPHRTGPLVPGQ